jgi:predicted PurR-regulated permease PerM
VSIIDQRTVRVLVTILLFVAGFAFVWTAWKMLVVFLFSIFFAYLLEPFVIWIGRYLHVSRGVSIAIVYLGVFAGLGVLFFFLGPAIVREGEKLSSAAPDLYNKIASGKIAWQIGSQHGWSHATEQRIQDFLATHRETILDIAKNIGERLARAGANAWYLVLIPILAVFFVKDGEKIGKSVVEFFERRRQREFIDALLSDIHLMLAQYIRTQLMLAGIAMCVYLAFLTVARVPYAAALGVVAGMLEFIPVLGPLIAALLVMGIPLAAGYGKLLYVAIFLIVWRGAQDYVISPRVMGSKLRLSPLAALFGVLVGAEIGGIIGVYLSIPIMAAIRIFWRRWRDYSVDAQLTPVTALAPVEREKTA